MIDLYRVEVGEGEPTRCYYRNGHLMMSVVLLDDDDVYIERIDVDEGFRGQGIGTAAVAEICEDHRRVYAAPDNIDSERFFARFGEKVIGKDVDGYVPYECLHYLDQGFGVYDMCNMTPALRRAVLSDSPRSI